jgi:hypothetical protein
VYHGRVPAALQIIRQSSFAPQPWANGGGITHEAIRVPSNGDSFLWRVSVARIEASGPFSDFSAYNRKMVLLKGDGLELEFGNGQHAELRRIGELAEFDGALKTHCRLVGGPCVDLNLMVAKSKSALARVVQVKGTLETRSAESESTLIFGIDSPITLTSGSDETSRLEPWDLAVMSNSAARVSRAAPQNSSAAGLVFFATISH